METYYRVEPGDRDPEDLLDPENQETEPWSGTVQGKCDKCGGSGETEHECESCSEEGVDPDCPACGGKVRYMDECPACEGSGQIDDTKRDGVSVFPDEDGLYRYMLKRDADLNERCQLVRLEGEESTDEDFDADDGALLVKPSRIVETGKLDWDRIEELRAELGDEVGSQAD